jgi:glycosyltransferase involved in cell wall biosynthesis
VNGAGKSHLTHPLRIVHVSPGYSPLVGGAERLLQGVSERLVERGHDVTVLTFNAATTHDFFIEGGARLPSREVLNGVCVIRVDPVGEELNRAHEWLLRRRGGYRLSRWMFGEERWPLWQPYGPRLLAPLFRARADVITSVNWHFGCSFWAVPPRRLRLTPRVAIPILHIEREWARNPKYPRMLRDCDAAIVLTDAECEFVEARGGRSVSVSGAGVDPERFQKRDGTSIRARYGIGDRPVVGFMGRQDTLKGAPTLIEAMHRVWEQSPDAMLLLAGQSAHRESRVTQMIAELTPIDRARVILIDDFADADGPSIMDACDILTLPSVEDSFGMVMIEAWVCGKPVIGGDIASTRCIIEPGVDGWIVKPFDAGDLAAKILDLVADPRKRVAFGERGHKKVLDRYTWERVTDTWETTFQQVASGR